MTVIARADAVGKRYRRGRERINFRALVPGSFGDRAAGEQHWALRGLSFELDEGRSLGFIGGNGAGKSTTLKLIAGVIAPSEGDVAVHGRSTSLIELGAGFHPDMTGRENVYFSAAVLGMSPRELRSRIDDIVEFADIGQFLDTPVKRYSSGMMARLGFSVAAHVQADLIVLDEVLAVGDTAFQRKCYDRISQIRRDGGALLYVTHALWTVPLLCDEAIMLERGTVAARGTPEEVVRAYESRGTATAGDTGNDLALIHRVSSSDAVIDPGQSFSCEIDVEWRVPAPNGHLAVIVADGPGEAHGSVLLGADRLPLHAPGRVTVQLRLLSLPLQPAPYQVYVAFVLDRDTPVVDALRSVSLDVRGDLIDPGFGALRIEHDLVVEPAHGAQQEKAPDASPRL